MHDHDNLGRREFLGTVGGLSIATLISQGLSPPTNIRAT